MLAILYCPECKKIIEEYGAPVFDLYSKIMENYFMRQSYSYIEPDELQKKQVVRFMEQKGLVVSTDIEDDRIAILPKGIRCIEGINGCLCHVCLKPNEHKNE